MPSVDRWYSVYGLTLRASGPIPGLVAAPAPAGGRADVRVRLGERPPRAVDDGTARTWCEPRDAGGEPIVSVRRGPWGFDVRYADGNRFWLDSAGRQVWASWPDGSTREDSATYLLGPVLGFVLRLRGVTCLHASAVEIDGRAVLFVGPGGAGKSTTATAFAARNHGILSDDVSVLTEVSDGFVVQPGYPCLRLRPETVEGLHGKREALPLMTPTWDRRFVDLSGEDCRFQSTPLRLAAAYALGRGCPVAEPSEVRRAEALLTLVANAYVSYFLDRTMQAQDFRRLATLAARVPVRSLTLSADLTQLPDLVDLVVEDVRAETNRRVAAESVTAGTNV